MWPHILTVIVNYVYMHTIEGKKGTWQNSEQS